MEQMEFSALCHGNGDMLIAGSNLHGWGTSEVINGPNRFPVSSKAMSVAFLGDDIIYYEAHCVSMINSGVVSVIYGSVSAE